MCLGERHGKQRTDALGRGKIKFFLEQGVFDHDENEEEKSKVLFWMNVSEVQVSSSGKIIPVPPSREVERGTGIIEMSSQQAEEDKINGIKVLKPMRNILENIYGQVENLAVNEECDFLLCLEMRILWNIVLGEIISYQNSLG